MPKRATLHLNLHREFFAQIAAGTKRTIQLPMFDSQFPICETAIRLRQSILQKAFCGQLMTANELKT
jgi:hypothetical protein